MSSHIDSGALHQLSESQWAIAARQFRKRTTAVLGLHGVRVLFYLAVFAPVICSGLPLLWQAPGGSLESPWLSRIFDTIYWKNGVDRLFNLLMFMTLAWWGFRLWLRFWEDDPEARAVLRARFFRWFVALVVALAVAQALRWSLRDVLSVLAAHLVTAFVVVLLISEGGLEDYPSLPKLFWGVLFSVPVVFIALGTGQRLLGLVVLCVVGAVWYWARRAKGEQAAARTSLARRIVKVLLVGLWLFGLLGGSTAPGLVTSAPYIDYTGRIQQFETEAADLETRLPSLSGDARAEAEFRLATLHDRSAVFTFIPFSHWDQSTRGEQDMYRGPMERSDRGLHVFGTTKTGQDVLSRLIFGTRISLTVGILAVAIYVTIGLIMGGLAGYFGGWVDLGIMRLIEIILSVPGLFLILTIIALFEERSIFMIMIAIGIVGWTGIARLVRGEFIRERGKDYVSAAKSLGLSNSRILFRHVMPNSVGPVIVSSTFGIAAAIITESTLSFLGLGDPNVPSWGQMLDAGRVEQQWHMIAVPGIAIFITVTLLNLVGDGLRDAMDPKLRK